MCDHAATTLILFRGAHEQLIISWTIEDTSVLVTQLHSLYGQDIHNPTYKNYYNNFYYKEVTL